MTWNISHSQFPTAHSQHPCFKDIYLCEGVNCVFKTPPIPCIVDVGLYLNYITEYFQPSGFIGPKTVSSSADDTHKEGQAELYNYTVSCVTRELVNDISYFCFWDFMGVFHYSQQIFTGQVWKMSPKKLTVTHVFMKCSNANRLQTASFAFFH